MAADLRINIAAPDFSLLDVNGNNIKLNEYHKKKAILLCLIRGFA
jgi:peroxiredoxin